MEEASSHAEERQHHIPLAITASISFKNQTCGSGYTRTWTSRKEILQLLKDDGECKVNVKKAGRTIDISYKSSYVEVE